MGIRTFFARCRENRITQSITRKLNLDPGQQQHLREVQQTLHSLRKDASEGWHYQRHALLELLSREHFDRDEALRLARLPMAMVNDTLLHAVDRFAEFYDALSVDQRVRLRTMLSHRRCGPRHCHAC